MKKETNILIKLIKGLVKAFALLIAQIAKMIYLIIALIGIFSLGALAICPQIDEHAQIIDDAKNER